MKKTDFTEKASGFIVKGQRGRSKSRKLKRDPDASNSSAYYYCRKPEQMMKNCMKYKEMLKKKCGKDFDGASTNRKSEQADIVEEVDENSCDVLTAQ